MRLFEFLIWKEMSQREMIFVFLGPFTEEYSHDRIAKKNARMTKSLMILSEGEMASFRTCLRSLRLAAAWRFVPGSS